MERHIIYQDAKTIRLYARTSLRGLWFLAVAGSFLVNIIESLPSYFVDGALDPTMLAEYLQTGVWHVNPYGAGILWLYSLLVAGPLSYGFFLFMSNILRRQPTGTGIIFSGFADFLKLFPIQLLTTLAIAGGSMLLVVPGIILACAYMPVYLLLMDHPELKVLEALKESRLLMRGNKAKLFVMLLGFIGWYLLLYLVSGGLQVMGLTFLSAILMVVGEAMINCYVIASECAFYDMANGKIVENVVNTGE